MKYMLGVQCALSALAIASLPSAAFAQDMADPAPDQEEPAGPATVVNPPDDTADGGRTGLNEIVVTATRRSSDLQTTPIAVSAVDSALIQQSSPRDIGDLAAFVPNFSAATIANFNAASFAMRGVGQTSIIVYFEPPVAVLVDDFVVPSVQTQLLDTFDIEQVEVLRGPQGTLFGKNTTGGVVTVRTKRPIMNYIGVEGRAEFGEFGTTRLQGAVNVPLGSIAALRLVMGSETSDGYYRNGHCYGPVTAFAPSKFNGQQGCLNGEKLGGKDVWQARAKLLVEPTDNISALFQYEWLRDRSDVVPSVNVNYLYEGDTPLLTDLLGLTDPNAENIDPIDRAAYTGRTIPSVNLEAGQRISVDGYYGNIDWDIGSGVITSVTGYRSQRSQIPNSYAGATAVAPDGERLSFFDASRDDDRKTFQQELRYASDFDGPFNFIAGGFYQRDKIDFCVSQILGFLDLTGGPLPFGDWNSTPYVLCNAQKATSKALFTEGTFEITPELSLTVGGRYSWDDKTWRGRQQAFAAELEGGFDLSIPLDTALDASVYDYPANVITVEDSWEEPTYRASLGWQATPDLFVYGTYSHGYKGGGFNDQIGGFAAFGTDLDAFREAAQATDPELADSFEAGIKSEFLNNRLRFNLTGFYVKYDDLQKQLNVPIEVNGQPNQVTLFVNAASAEVKGLELEASANPFAGFTLRGVLGYQDGKYKEYDAPNAGYDLSTAPLDRAPEWQWTIDGNYELPLGAEHSLTLNGNVAYTDRNLNTQAIDDPLGNTFLDARTLVNASITLGEIDNKYYIRAIGRNLTDERYRVGIQNVAGLWVNAQYGAPRYFGLEVGAKFGQDLYR